MQALDPMSAEDSGIAINATLTFTDFDPTGATFELDVRGQAPRAMEFYAGVATYVTVPGDFVPGYYYASVRATNGGVSVSSEVFMLVVTP